MESKRFALHFYKNVILPQQCIFTILSYLHFKDLITLVHCCQLSNQLIKFYYFKKNNCTNIVTYSQMHKSDDDNPNTNYIDLYHTCVDTSQLNQFDVSFINLTFSQSKNCFVMVNCGYDESLVQLPKHMRLRKSIKMCLQRDRSLRNGRFVLRQFMCEEEKDDDNCNKIEWYVKASTRKDEWHLIDKKIQNQIEKCHSSYKYNYNHNRNYDSNHQNEQEHKIETFGYWRNNKSKYIIYFDNNTNNKINNQLNEEYNANETYYKNNHRLLSYDHWRHSFTKYFYQQNVNRKSYRILKRVDKGKQICYHNIVTNKVIENYFFDLVPHII